MSSQGVGARLVRKEDDRLVRGRGQFVADIRLPAMKDVAFVRSPLAHARIRGISIPPDQRDSTFTAAFVEVFRSERIQTIPHAGAPTARERVPRAVARHRPWGVSRPDPGR